MSGHNVHDSDTHFVVDPITRTITNMSSKKTVLIQGDHNSERFTFEIPRYIEAHDMALCNKVEIHYINIDSGTKAQNADIYVCDDFAVDADNEDIVTCSWLISANATRYVGSLNFVLRFACVTEDKVDYSWNTAVHGGITVVESINNSESIVEQYSDILEAWHSELMSAGTLGVNIVENAKNQALEEIQTEVTTATDAANVATNAASVASNASNTASTAANTAQSAAEIAARAETSVKNAVKKENTSIYDIAEYLGATDIQQVLVDSEDGVIIIPTSPLKEVRITEIHDSATYSTSEMGYSSLHKNYPRKILTDTGVVLFELTDALRVELMEFGYSHVSEKRYQNYIYFEDGKAFYHQGCRYQQGEWNNPTIWDGESIIESVYDGGHLIGFDTPRITDITEYVTVNGLPFDGTVNLDNDVREILVEMEYSGSMGAVQINFTTIDINFGDRTLTSDLEETLLGGAW